VATSEELNGVVTRVFSGSEPASEDVLRLLVESPTDVSIADPHAPMPIKMKVRSSIEAAYTDAMNASNGGTSWIGALGHLAYLDAVGGALNVTGRETSSQTSLERALELFSDLDERHRACVYALRCCLIHDFSLANLPAGNSRPNLLRQHFRLWPARQLNELIQFSDPPWDGDLMKLVYTDLDLGRLSDLAASVHQRMQESYQTGNLSLRKSALATKCFYLFAHPAEL